MYLFGFVGMLVLVDIIFMIPTTAVSSARLRRDQLQEIMLVEIGLNSYYIIVHKCIT